MARPNNSAAIGAYITGLKEAKAAFQAVPEAFRERLADAAEKTVREIARAAQGRLAASPSIQSRNLYNAVGWSMNRNNGKGRAGIQRVTTTINGRKVRGIITAGRGGSASTAAGARKDVPSRRAHFIEFGTRNMPAEPFMIPAAESQQAPYLARCQAAGKDAERDLAQGRNL